jgi:pyrimidine-specific ribonucleoside hydrolase
MDVILDVDTGVDDAMAILLAARSPVLNVLGITCVMGNTDLDYVVPNTLKVLDVADRPDIPVARGMDRALLETKRNAKQVHGEDGLGHIELPPPSRQPVPEHAVEFLRKTVLTAREPVTLIPLAPLTNIATLLIQHPEVKANIKQIVLMGGAIEIGNASATAEFNIRQDPEAADVVFTCGLPLVMYGLEVFREVRFNQSEAQAFINSGKPAAQLAGRLLKFFMDNFHREAVTIGDAGAVASVIDPAGLTTEAWPVRVELHGTWTRGQTVVDRRPQYSIELEAPWMPPMGTKVAVATAVDSERYRQLFSQAVLS